MNELSEKGLLNCCFFCKSKKVSYYFTFSAPLLKVGMCKDCKEKMARGKPYVVHRASKPKEKY